MEKIIKLRKYFKKEKIDGYLVPKNDEFFGEYIPNYNDRLNFISNFSGSYGFALILKTKNYLFVDGRYTLQALKQSGKFFKIITFPQIMPSEILKNKRLTIGFDPNLFTKKTITFFGKNNCNFKPLENNLVDKIWKRKLKFSKNNFYKLPENSVGESYKLKINKIVYNLKKKSANYHFITASENSAWLFNIRGRDVKYSPLPHSYVLINQNKDIKFFCDLKKISKSFKKKFNKVKFLNKRALRAELSKINGMKFLIDKNTCSIFYENLIVRNNKILDLQDPIYNLKAIKSKKEITNIRKTHIYDGVALTKFLIWLKKIIQKEKSLSLAPQNNY